MGESLKMVVFVSIVGAVLGWFLIIRFPFSTQDYARTVATAMRHPLTQIMCWRLLAEFSSIGGVYGTHYVMIGWKNAYACRSEALTHHIQFSVSCTQMHVLLVHSPITSNS
ncbi:hypothetical protein JB92DRAFT_3029991 [Gautieria morchelliformis]|nr:hypothetical protein JB92DRAFT_3029991 [Gautieria morchelliformis]